MKFNCGPTWEEKRTRIENWHVWFAWRPVRLSSHDCRWLERVERKGAFPTFWFPSVPQFMSWEYRALVPRWSEKEKAFVK